MNSLEREIRRLTTPINGQYPRPWMTADTDPATVEVFIVGRNQKNGYPVDQVGSQDDYIDALFNRNGRSCRGLHDRIAGSPSPTRRNSDALVGILAGKGVSRTVETNVICYSSRMSGDLGRAEHKGGKHRGKEIFAVLLELIRPRVIIAHGSATLDDLSDVLDTPLPGPPGSAETVISAGVAGVTVYPIPSLAPPASNMWHKWRGEYLDRLADDVARTLAGPG
ncbi:hypothetical protein [Paracoccus sp. SSK6]|uniref:hypothetical protein n=1 Tax=Paracoccus sp. SSK6 TaxID=3143131 RepID=UPI00321AC20C